MKTLTVAIISSAAALLLAACSGHNHDGQFDTNSAEIGPDRRPGETNLMVAQRTGANMAQFEYVEPAEPEVKPVAEPAVEKNSDVPPTKKSQTKVEPVEPTASQEMYIDTTSYETTTTASSVVEEAPKTKKELRKEKKEARKAKRNN